MVNGNRPDFYGLISIGTSKNAVRVGKMAVWRQTVPPATKRPPYTGNLEIEGRKYKIALWENIDPMGLKR
jgi:hypothetical protein